jgi:hypothetical protein
MDVRSSPICGRNPGLKSETWATHSILSRPLQLLPHHVQLCVE